jgi:hypothetical protein
MFRWVIGLVGATIEQRVRDSLLGIGVIIVSALFATVSLGFGTFGAYVYVSESEGPVVTALILCALYGLLAFVIWAVWAARRRAALGRRAAAAPTTPGNVDSLIQSLAGAGAPEDQQALAAAMRLGRQLSPIQILALALISGFIAGRKLSK